MLITLALFYIKALSVPCAYTDGFKGIVAYGGDDVDEVEESVAMRRDTSSEGMEVGAGPSNGDGVCTMSTVLLWCCQSDQLSFFQRCPDCFWFDILCQSLRNSSWDVVSPFGTFWCSLVKDIQEWAMPAPDDRVWCEDIALIATSRAVVFLCGHIL